MPVEIIRPFTLQTNLGRVNFKLRTNYCCGAMELLNVRSVSSCRASFMNEDNNTSRSLRFKKQVMPLIADVIRKQMLKSDRSLLLTVAVNPSKVQNRAQAFIHTAYGAAVNTYTISKYLKLKPGAEVINKNNNNIIRTYSGAPVWPNSPENSQEEVYLDE